MIHGAAGRAIALVANDSGGARLTGDGKGGLVNKSFGPKSLKINNQFGVWSGVI